MTDLFFLRYPPDVELIIIKQTKILFHNSVSFICSNDGACSFTDQNGNRYAYAPGKLALDTPSANYEDLPVGTYPFKEGTFFTRTLEKEEVFQRAKEYFLPLAYKDK
jgi:hypothetical protein